MLEFHALTPESVDEIAPLFRAAGVRACDYSFGACYQWRDYYKLTYCVRDGIVFMQGVFYDPFGLGYQMPAGMGDIDKALDELDRDARKKGLPLRIWIPGEKALESVKAHFKNRVTDVKPVRDQFDYLYDINDLKTFSGKKMHGQKNHLNRFLRENPEAEFVPVTPETLAEAETFMSDYEQETEFASQLELDEMESSRELLRLSARLGLTAGFIRTGRGVAALSIGEVIRDTLYVHVEKARKEFSGSYQAIVSLFARYAAGDGVLWCDREDDSGDPGLRTSKLSYQPAGFTEKYAAVIGGEISK